MAASLPQRLRTSRTRSQLQLTVRLARRQITQRYRDSAFGTAWSVINPLFLLGIYYVMFTKIFPSRWTGEFAEHPTALLIFSGLLVFNLYSEIVNGSTFLAQNNAPLIKRTTVSLRVLPLAASLTATFTFLLSAVPFAVLYLILDGLPPLTIVLVPLVLAPLLVLATGIALLLASVAAYVRDLQQLIPLTSTMVLFLSPVFFNAESLPERARPFVNLSPVGVVLPASKDLMFFGRIPDLVPLVVYSLVAAAVFAFGWWVYGKASKGFADVV